MRFRRNNSNVTDLEAFRRGAASNGAYDDRVEYIHVNDDTGEYTIYTNEMVRDFTRDRLPKDHSPASSAVGEHRPELSIVPRDVEGSGLSNDEKRRQVRTDVWARRDRATIAEASEYITLLEEENDVLYRENLRLRSELNQAIAQARIARTERDRARNERDDARARASRSK